MSFSICMQLFLHLYSICQPLGTCKFSVFTDLLLYFIFCIFGVFLIFSYFWGCFSQFRFIYCWIAFFFPIFLICVLFFFLSSISVLMYISRVVGNTFLAILPLCGIVFDLSRILSMQINLSPPEGQQSY